MQTNMQDLFERPMTYPDFEAQERFSRLVGLDDQKSRLTKILSVLVNPYSLEKWAQKFHPDADRILETIIRRPPLVVLAGDVGTGKSELSETIGDSIARQEKIDITLLPLSLATRGQGRVGEMTQLISSAFDYTIQEAVKLKSESGQSRGAIILLVDEADALAQSREASQMHHEDKAGVNAFIRGVDRLASRHLPAAVIMCTNRLNALDPAIRRRAAEILVFSRPNNEQRRSVLENSLNQLNFTRAQIEEIIHLTGSNEYRNYGFTFSDLTQRLLPAIVLDAYPNTQVNPDRALDIARSILPTVPFQETSR